MNSLSLNLIIRELQPLIGAVRLAMFDVKGLTRMDNTQRGVWISFLAPLVVLPVMLWIVSMESGMDAAGFAYYVRQALSYIVSVFGFPVAMHYIAGFVGRGARYPLMVAAVNWTTPVQVLLMTIGALFYFWDVVPGSGDVLLMIISTFNIVYLWFTIRASLAVSSGLAILLVCLMAMIQMVGVLLTQVKFA